MPLPFMTKAIMYFKWTSQTGAGSVGAGHRHIVGAALGLSGSARVLAGCPHAGLCGSAAPSAAGSGKPGRGPVCLARASAVP